MNYTVNQLHKRLSSLIEQGHGRKPVVVDKESYKHNCESDGVTILGLSGLDIQWVPISDDDGGTKLNKDGSESGRKCLVLVGDTRANSMGGIVRDSRKHDRIVHQSEFV